MPPPAAPVARCASQLPMVVRFVVRSAPPSLLAHQETQAVNVEGRARERRAREEPTTTPTTIVAQRST